MCLQKIINMFLSLVVWILKVLAIYVGNQRRIKKISVMCMIILSLMLNGFNREGLELPWDSASDEALRKVIIISGMDVCYRYPELVAQVIELADDFSSSSFRNQISSLNSLVKWHIGEEEVNINELQEDLAGITLPKELLAKTRTMLRPAADTIVSAIYNYRRVTHGN
jgi:hypothetical protein